MNVVWMIFFLFSYFSALFDRVVGVMSHVICVMAVASEQAFMVG